MISNPYSNLFCLLSLNRIKTVQWTFTGCRDNWTNAKRLEDDSATIQPDTVYQGLEAMMHSTQKAMLALPLPPLLCG